MNTTSKKVIPSLSTKVANTAKGKAAAKEKAKLVKKRANLETPLVSSPLVVNRGPAIEKPVAPLALRASITPELIARIESEAAMTMVAPIELGMPYAVFIAEGIKCANMVHKYQESPDPRKFPALSLYADRIGGPEVAAEILYLTDRADTQRDEAKDASAPVGDSQVERARFVNRELRLAAELDADDGVRDEKDVSLESLRKTHAADPSTNAELGDSIGSYARHARKHQESFKTIPNFDANLIEEGLLLSDALRSRTANTGTNTALASRDAYLELIRVRIAKVRKVVRYAFRATPEVVREATSAYLREKRRSERKPDPLEGDEPLPSPAGEEGGDDE